PPRAARRRAVSRRAVSRRAAGSGAAADRARGRRRGAEHRIVLHDFGGWPSGPLHLALGVFDGVHLGHQALIRRLVGGARAAGATSLAATFDPLPAQVLAQDPPQSTLADAPERAALLEHSGAQDVVVFTFDKAFSEQ